MTGHCEPGKQSLAASTPLKRSRLRSYEIASSSGTPPGNDECAETTPRNDRGFVLVVVLWVLAILTVITLGVGKRVILDARAAAYALDQSAAQMQARGAVHRGIIEVRNKIYKDYLEQEQGQNFVVLTHLGQEWAKPLDLYTEGKYFEPLGEEEEDVVEFHVEDADRYINVNMAASPVGEKLLENLHSQHEVMPRDVRRRISNRLTKGDWEDEGGIAFHSPEEIRYVRGVDDEDWFGEQDGPGLKDLITTWGGPQININTAPREVLVCIPEVSEGDADAILAFRNGSDGEPGTDDDDGFRDWDELSKYAGVSGETLTSIQQNCKLNSSVFIVTGLATRRQGRVRALSRAIVQVEGFAGSIIAWQETTFGS